MDSIVRFLTSCGPSHKTKDFLEDLGKTAARKMVGSEEDMNSTIAGFVKDNALNREQTRRVVEAANNEAFSLLMKKEAGYITFDVADATKCGGTEVKTKLAKANYIPGEDFISTEKLAHALFGEVGGAEEQTSAVEDPIATRQKLAHMLDAVEDLKSRALSKVASLQNYVAEAVQTGELSVDEVSSALAASGSSPEFIKIACARTEVCRGTGNDPASSIPNPKHPLLVKAAECKEATRLYMESKAETMPQVEEILNAAK